VGDIDGDGAPEIVVGCHDSRLYAYEADGSAVAGNWPRDLGSIVASSPALGDITGDSAAEIFVGANNGRLYGLHGDGSPIDTLFTLSDVSSSPAICDADHDGIAEVFVGSSDGGIHRFKTWTSQMNTDCQPWPMFRHDDHRTGNLAYLGPRTICVPDEYATIQAAINAATDGDWICVAPGEYYESLVIEGFDFLVIKTGCCDDVCGWATVDPPTSVPAVRFNNVGSGVRFEGFVLTGGTCGMSLSDSDPQIRNVTIYGNENGIELSNSSPALVNSVVADNDMYGIYLSGSSCPVLNGNIVSGNFRGIYGATACCVDAHYNDVWGNTVNFGGACSGQWPPDQNMSQDPKYAGASVADYHLCVDSPCIDRGDPDSSECDPDGSRNDMGAYGGPQACQDYPSYAKGLKAVAESTVVSLTWDGNSTAESVSYYIVYRDTALGFVPDAGKHYRDVYGTSLTDTVGLNTRYAYNIAAVDNHCYQGGYSVSIQAETCPLREGVLTASYSWGCPVENSIRGNVVAKGVGLRGTGTGSIVLTGIPAEAHIVKALLYWDWSPYVSLNGVRVGATTVGRDHGVSGYRADVAHVVNGNGTYVVSVDGASDGASLVVVYEDSTMARRAITINDGLESEGPGSGGNFDNTYFAYDQQDSVYACYIVGGGTAGLSEAYYYNLQMVAADSADGSDGASWDTDWISIHPLAAKPPPGQFGASAHIVEITDSLNWVAVVNVGLLLPAGVSDRDDAAEHSWALAPVKPNPSGSTMVVEFDVPKGGGKISLVVYDVAGRLVRTLVDGSVSAGRHSIDWDATRHQGMQVSPGIYFIRMEAGSYRATKKVVMLD
jgi:hypothetical protein